MGIFYTIIASLFWALGNVFDHHLTARTVKNPLALTFLAFCVRIPIVILFFLFFGFFIPSPSILFIVIAGGIATVVALFCYYYSQEKEEASSVMLMFTVFSPILILLLSFLFLGEQLEGKEWAGFWLLLAASVFASMRRTHEIFHISKIFWLMLLATIGWSVADIISKYATPFFPSSVHLFTWTMAGIALGSFVFLFSTSWRKKGILDISHFKRADFVLHFTSVGMSTIGYLLFFKAVYLEKISILVVVASFIPFFSFIFEIIFSKFFLSFRQEPLGSGNFILKSTAFALFLFGIYFLSVVH